MKIAILGTRGIPNNYGGFEQLAEYLSVQLVERGHDIAVYNSSNHSYQFNNYKGVKIIHCYDPEKKMGTFGQFIYDLNCILDARKRGFDILLQLGYTSSSVWYMFYPKKCKVICNMDGMEWKRSKYSKPVQLFLKVAEKLAATKSNYLISDAVGIQNYLFKKYQLNSTFIPYGASIFSSKSSINSAQILKKYKVNAHAYYLLICRFEPENNIETIIKGYLKSAQKFPLILIGASNNKFSTYLKQNYKSDKIIYLNAVYALDELNILRHYCTLYFHGHTVGGTNPSLLEAMASQACICAHNNQFNREVLETNAFFFTNENDISSLINQEPNATIKSTYIEANLLKLKSVYQWPAVIDAYEKLFFNVFKHE